MDKIIDFLKRFLIALSSVLVFPSNKKDVRIYQIKKNIEIFFLSPQIDILYFLQIGIYLIIMFLSHNNDQTKFHITIHT